MEKPQETEEGYFTADEELGEDLLNCQIAVEKTQLLASGGFGSVFAAWHKVKQIPLVVKVTRLTEDDEENVFLWDTYEIELDFYERSVGRSDLSWVPRFYGSGVMPFEGAECPWIALERLHGCLDSLCKTGEAANLYLHLALGALNALEGLHAEGYVHRDIKPENFAVRKDAYSGEYEVCLIDFGLLIGYQTTERENDQLKFTGTLEYSSERQLKERMVGPADDLESLGYALLHLYMGEGWYNWDKHDRKNRQLKKFAKENQALILPTRHRKKRGRQDPTQLQEPQLPVVSANERPRNQPRLEEEEKEKEQQSVLEARIVLAPAPAAPAAAPVAAVALQKAPLPVEKDEATQDEPIVSLGEQCIRTLKRRKDVWARLEKQGKIPDFLTEWMSYCKSLSAYDCPDYDKLRALLKQAPEVAHIALALHGKQPMPMQQEE